MESIEYSGGSTFAVLTIGSAKRLACPVTIRREVMTPAQPTARPPEEALFAIDERLADLTDQAPGAAAEIGEVPRELLAEIDDCLDAFRTKVDRIAGRRRRRESIAAILGKKVGRRPAPRKKAAEGRLERLEGMLLAFMLSLGAKRLEGAKAAIGMQSDSAASLVIGGPAKRGDVSFETSARFTKTEPREIVSESAAGELRRRLVDGLANLDRRLLTAAADPSSRLPLQ